MSSDISVSGESINEVFYAWELNARFLFFLR